MSTQLGAKIRKIRDSFGLSREAFGQLVTISAGVIKKYENGSAEIGSTPLQKILQTPQFSPFTLWLILDITMPLVGQVAPNKTKLKGKEKKAAQFSPPIQNPYQQQLITQITQSLVTLETMNWITTGSQHNSIGHDEIAKALYNDLTSLQSDFIDRSESEG